MAVQLPTSEAVAQALGLLLPSAYGAEDAISMLTEYVLCFTPV